MEFDVESGSYTEDVMDFWRPNYMDEALVDGKYSIKVYLKALTESWKEYQREANRSFSSFSRFCYHLPFTRMAEKAHQHLAKLTGQPGLSTKDLNAQLSASLLYNRNTGNCYTASLYVGLASLLENTDENLTGHRIGLFSYGSGCMATYFSGTVLAGYREAVAGEHHRHMLEERRELSYVEYRDFYQHRLPTDGKSYSTTTYTQGLFRLSGIRAHKRIYQCVSTEQANKTKISVAKQTPAGVT